MSRRDGETMRRDVRASRRALLAIAALALSALVAPLAPARELGDVLPFRLVHGRPPEDADSSVAQLWSEGGRLKLRFQPEPGVRTIEGRLEMNPGGIFKDVRPLTENLRVRMSRPNTLVFDVEMQSTEEGFDVLLSGDFTSLRLDLRIDGERRPEELVIGERAERPAGLPAQFELDDASAIWVERFGFR